MKGKALVMVSIFLLAFLTGCFEKKDKEAPYIQLSIDGKESNGWYRTNVTIKIQAKDNQTKVKELKYRIDGGLWKDYVMPIKLKENGEHFFEYYATDKHGNKKYGNLTIKIDKIKPTLAFQNFEAGYTYMWGEKKLTLRFPRDTMIIGKMSIIAIANDSLSGMQKVEFYLGDELSKSVEKPPYEWQLPATIGVYNITAIAYDMAGNENSITIPDVQFFILR